MAKIESIDDLKKGFEEDVTVETHKEEVADNNQQIEDAKQDATIEQKQEVPQEEIAQQPVFQPNYKLEIRGKHFEIPEEFRGLIKDKDSETKIRDIFNKAYGLDDAVQTRDKWKTNYETLNKQFSEINKANTENEGIVNHVSDCLERIDNGDVLEGLSLLVGNNEALLSKIFEGIINYHNADDLGREKIINKYTNNINRYVSDKELKQRERETSDISDKYTKILVREADYNISKTIDSNNEFKTISEIVQERTGDDKFIKKYIVNAAKKMYDNFEDADFSHVTKVAFSDLKRIFGINGTPNSTPPTNLVNQGQNSPQNNVVIKKREEASMPSMDGYNTGAVVKKKFTSLEDVRKKYYGEE